MKILESEFVISASQLSGAPAIEVSEVAFLGRSNVGKSSMINALLQRRKLARVSNTPGRTRLLNFFRTTVETDAGRRLSLSLCDLPGYGYAKAPREEIAKWRAMIEGYLGGRAELRGAVILIDARLGPTDLDRTLLGWLSKLGLPTLTLLTKIDKLPKNRRLPTRQSIGHSLGQPAPSLGFSSETGEGWDEVWNNILNLLRPNSTRARP
jgi:GTP-binding protein